ncbi:MAG: hypothetical protein IPG84_18360 [Betaproteobacteria bacterium]|nr:hypothetical protein [Betaproteobacteria bacterium]
MGARGRARRSAPRRRPSRRRRARPPAAPGLPVARRAHRAAVVRPRHLRDARPRAIPRVRLLQQSAARRARSGDRGARDAAHPRGARRARAAALVAAHDLDVLVDLAGHTGHNRLAIFARRPARVAMTWLDYVSTTGMSTIDWRISDALADPPGVAERANSERLMRLPVPAWCWTPPADSPASGPPPLVRLGTPTFGSFNHSMKLTDATLAMWRALFALLPAARLVAVGVPAGSSRRRVTDALAIAPARVEFAPRLDDAGYRAMFARVDVALDPLPFSGATTTLDALWQGVPVVTLPGPWTWSRSSASLLAGLGAEAWIARDAGHYASIACGLVGDGARLADIRAGLRARVAASPMTDVAGFVRHLEDAYRCAWTAYVSGQLHRDDEVGVRAAC